jgi:hypothetical protein
MEGYGRSVLHASNLAFWQLGVVPRAQQLLFVTWGCRIHKEQGLIVQAIVCHLLNA